MEEMTTLQRIFQSGKDSLAIIVPKRIAQLNGYRKGGLVKVTWKDFIEILEKEKKRVSKDKINKDKEEIEEKLPNLDEE